MLHQHRHSDPYRRTEQEWTGRSYFIPNVPNPYSEYTSPRHTTSSSQNARKAKAYEAFLAFCKTARLPILSSFWDAQKVEEPKIAFDKNRCIVIIRGMVHWIPLSGAGVLIGLNFWQYYLGVGELGIRGQDTLSSAALQFLAKLHELFMLASIATIAFAAVREELAFGKGVTFGTICASHNVANLNNLWSEEFWSGICDARKPEKHARSQKWYKISPRARIVWLIFLATVLGLLVGPFGAVLMRPRLDWWPAGGTYFWLNATPSAIFAESISTNALPDSCCLFDRDMSCPYGGFETLIEQYAVFWPQLSGMSAMPESVWLPGMKSLRETKIFQRTSPDDLWARGYTWAQAPFEGVADAIAELTRLWTVAAESSDRKRRFRYRMDDSFSVEDYQPYVKTFCKPNRVNASSETERFALSFADMRGEPSEVTRDETFKNMSAFPEVYRKKILPGTLVTSWLESAIFNSTSNSLTWLDDPTALEATNSSLLSIVTLPDTAGAEQIYLTCNMKTLLVPATSIGNSTTPASISFANRSVDELLEIAHLFSSKPSTPARVIWPTAAWASYTNPYLPAYDLDVFARMCLAAGLSKSSPRKLSLANVPYAVESIISLMIVNALSRMPYRTTMVGNLTGMNDPTNILAGGTWTNELMPKAHIGFGGYAYETTPETELLATKFQLQARVQGYAYTYATPPRLFSILVMLAYSALALWHVAASLIKGVSSGAWDSTAELVALAFNSGREDGLRNTGAGIHSKQRTMMKVAMVGARMDEDGGARRDRDGSARRDRLGLVFGMEPGEVDALEVNRFYR